MAAADTITPADQAELVAAVREAFANGTPIYPVGGGTSFPYAHAWLESIGCAGAGKVYRLAQVVAAAALCLEISASSAMATAGSENFFKAHHERGGLR